MAALSAGTDAVNAVIMDASVAGETIGTTVPLVDVLFPHDARG